MRRGGGRMCLMHKSSVHHADNLVVLQGERQKRHDITHRSVVPPTSSPWRTREQRQFCAGTRETMRRVAVYQSHRPDITHTTTKRKQSSRCLGGHPHSVMMTWRAAVRLKHHNTLSHDKHGATRGPQLVEWR
ncbi:hypothetical protein TRVL_07377 [Trypanosoma vivax]|nr:hypothetical protein TRVL_07377 [Trypanosoma vivax]